MKKEISPKELREIFNTVISQQTDRDKISKLELCREYFTDQKFARSLENFIWEAR